MYQYRPGQLEHKDVPEPRQVEDEDVYVSQPGEEEHKDLPHPMQMEHEGNSNKRFMDGHLSPHPTLPPSLLGLKPSPSTGHNEDGLDWSIG